MSASCGRQGAAPRRFSVCATAALAAMIHSWIAGGRTAIASPEGADGACRNTSSGTIGCPGFPGLNVQLCLQTAGAMCGGHLRCALAVVQECVDLFGSTSAVSPRTGLQSDGTCAVAEAWRKAVERKGEHCPGEFHSIDDGFTCRLDPVGPVFMFWNGNRPGDGFFLIQHGVVSSQPPISEGVLFRYNAKFATAEIFISAADGRIGHEIQLCP